LLVGHRSPIVVARTGHGGATYVRLCRWLVSLDRGGEMRGAEDWQRWRDEIEREHRLREFEQKYARLRGMVLDDHHSCHIGDPYWCSSPTCRAAAE
jgi:hypothetical protein